MLTNARLNQKLLNDLIIFPDDCAVSGLKRNENTSDARINPSTNFGKRSQIMLIGTCLAGPSPFFLYAQKMEMANAASPSSTFWENFTIVAYFKSCLPGDGACCHDSSSRIYSTSQPCTCNYL